MHNLLHIVQTMRNNGPSVHYSYMRYESKHHHMKQLTVATCNRKKLAKTMCTRTLLKLAYFKLTGKLDLDEVIFYSCEPIDPYYRSLYFPLEKKDSDVVTTDSVTFNGYDYDVGFVLEIEINKDEISFGVIDKIFVKNSSVFFVFQKLLVDYYDDHLHAYVVKKIKFFLKISKIFQILPHVFMLTKVM